MKNSQRLLTLLLSLAFASQSTQMYCAAPAKSDQNASVISGTKGPEPDPAGLKPALVYKAGDLSVALLGKTKIEYFFARNSVMLNDDIPDEFNYFRHIADIALDVSWGEHKYGHKAVELFFDIRQRNMWGDSGRYVINDPATIKIDQAVTGPHTHKNGKPLLWIRDLWLEASINAICGFTSKTTHYIRAGLFPYWLGRGIALGVYYGASKDYLGLYSYMNDQNPPGIQIRGDILKDELSYDLYYARFEEKGASIGDTFNYVKDTQVSHRNRPFRGVGKDNELWAARLKWQALKNVKTGNLNFEPYIFYEEASDQQIELPADVKSEIGTYGCAFEYTYKDFEFGGELAFNYGQERVRAIDRNIVAVVARDEVNPGPQLGDLGDMVELFNKVTVAPVPSDPTKDTPFVANKTNAALLRAATTTANATSAFNGQTFTVNDPVAGPITLRNASDRFRDAYVNLYRGWMAVLDAAYNIPNIDLKPAVAFGYASGGKDPHVVEQNKSYHGFVGINENYAGVRVPSLLILDARKLKRPLHQPFDSLVDIEDEAEFDADFDNDNSFTDIIYFGLGLSWFPIKHDASKFLLNPNVLFYWNRTDTPKVNPDTGTTISGTEADHFLGTELNLATRYEMLKDLAIYGNFAFFFPGGYYSDVKGSLVSGIEFKGLLLEDPTGMPQVDNIGLGNDTIIYLNIGIEYKF